MNYAQRRLIVALLISVAVILAFVFLQWGEGAFNSLGGNRIAIFLFGSDYGLFTTKGIPGVLLGLVAPICLLAGAAFVALGTEAK